MVTFGHEIRHVLGSVTGRVFSRQNKPNFATTKPRPSWLGSCELKATSVFLRFNCRSVCGETINRNEYNDQDGYPNHEKGLALHMNNFGERPLATVAPFHNRSS